VDNLGRLVSIANVIEHRSVLLVKKFVQLGEQAPPILGQKIYEGANHHEG
jgi:hypothetical protein